MKNIFKISILSFVLASIGSCTDDKDPVVSTNGFALRKDDSVIAPTVFSEANKTDTFAKLSWDRSNYGMPTVATYAVYISDHDLDPNFENGVESTAELDIDVADARTAEFSVEEFNNLINRLPSFTCNQMNIDIRVKSKLGNSSNAVYQYSNPITVAVKGYPKSLPILAFVKDSGDPTAASKLAASDYTSSSNYEGYMYLEAGNYTLYQPNACGDFTSPTIYGLTSGSIGGTGSFVVTTAGHYFVKANLSSSANSDTGVAAMSYVITPFTSFGIFGAAKGLPTGANRAMTYNPTNKKWELTFDLFKGRKFRFKSVNGTAGVSVLGMSSPNQLIEYPLTATTGGDIRVPGTDDGTKQKYDIKIDTNNPRNYTYELELNPN